MFSQKNIILLIAVLVALIVGILIGIGVYYYSSPQSPLYWQNQSKKEAEKKAAEEAEKKAAEEALKRAEFEKLMKETYPDIIKGTLNLSGPKITIKTEDGKEYWVWPVISRDYYEEKGLTNGQHIEIRGRIMPKDAQIKEDRIMMGPVGL